VKKYSLSNSPGLTSPNEVETKTQASSVSHQTSAEDKPRQRSTFAVPRRRESSQSVVGFYLEMLSLMPFGGFHGFWLMLW